MWPPLPLEGMALCLSEWKAPRKFPQHWMSSSQLNESENWASNTLVHIYKNICLVCWNTILWENNFQFYAWIIYAEEVTHTWTWSSWAEKSSRLPSNLLLKIGNDSSRLEMNKQNRIRYHQCKIALYISLQNSNMCALGTKEYDKGTKKLHA